MVIRLGLGPGDNYFCFFFFFLCVKVTKTFVLLSWHVTVQHSDVRPTLCDVMMMYSKERYMENLPHGQTYQAFVCFFLHTVSEQKLDSGKDRGIDFMQYQT